MTQVRLHCAPDVTAPHSFNLLLQQCAKEQKLSVISRKHSTTAGGTLCTQKLSQRRNEGPRNDPKWPPHHNASPLRAQNSHRATTIFFCSNALIALARSLCKCLLAMLITASEADAVTGFLVRGASQYDTIPRREKKNTATKPTQARNKTTKNKNQHKKAQKHHKKQNITKWNDISKSNDET